MKTYLIPVDFSDTMQVTLDYAIYLTKDQPCSLFLFHIYPDQLMIPDSSFPTGVDTDAFLSTEYINELRKQAEKNMEEAVKDLEKTIRERGLRHIEVESQISGGDPEWEINDICEKLQPQLIIMGSRGEGKKGFLEGSMAEKIMIRAQRPVIAVPEETEEIGLKNLMYATSFESRDLASIISIHDVLEHLDIKIHIVHFRLKQKDDLSALRMDQLKQSLQDVLPDYHFTYHLIDGGEKDDALHGFIKDYHIDMISFIAHKTNIFKNLFSNKITKKDFFKLELPMLALPDAER